MELFRADNTIGYTDAELELLNAEWSAIVEAKNLEEYTEKYDIQAKEFSDSVAKR